MPVDAHQYMRHKEAAQLKWPQNLSYDCLLTCATIHYTAM